MSSEIERPDPVIRGLERGEDTRGWDKGSPANEPDDAAEREEYRRWKEQLEEDD